MFSAYRHIILFDGVCNLCNHSVQFIIKRDRKGIFKFASLQSAVAQDVLKKMNAKNFPDSIAYIEEGKLFTKSDAALRIARTLNGGWRFLYYFIFIPRVIRNAVYGFIARNRYKWFGKKQSCMVPATGLAARFLQ